MPRIFITCGDRAFCEKIQNSLNAQCEFVVCGCEKIGLQTIEKALQLLPDLIIIETDMCAGDGLFVAESVKRLLPNTPVFLVTDTYSFGAEKESLSRGVDAVFQKGQVSSLIKNVRGACGLE